MFRFSLLMVLAVLAGGLVVAAPAGGGEAGQRSRPRLSPSLDLLPAGSLLQDVRIPRYDEEKRRAALLRAGALKVVSEDHVAGTNIEVRVFDRRERQTFQVNLGAGDYFRTEGLLKARDTLTVRGSGFSARGPSAVFHLDSRQGFLHGPVETLFRPGRSGKGEPTTRTTQMRPPARLVATGAVLVLSPPAVAGPSALTSEELADLDAMARPRAHAVLADTAPTREILTRSEQLARAADAGRRSLAHRLGDPPYLVVSTSPPAEGRKPEVPPRPEGGIEVTCDGGMFFDADKGHIVYLDNIVVVEPRFRLTAARELKVFLEKRADADQKGLEGPESFGDVKIIVATGGVVVERKDSGSKREPVIASADTATYDAQSGDFVLRGGFPTIRQGRSSLQAGEPGLYLRFYANGNFFAEKGRWKTIGDIARIRAQQEDR